MNAPLDGILVIALEQAVAAPFCTSRLADAGARVIKIERAEGDFARAYDHVAHGESAYFVWLNRGKESIVLDIKQPEDAALLARMIARADVLVQNLAPGAAERAGFGSEALRAKHPRLITCDISGYGEDGPYRDMKAYDLLIQCETGLASITGAPEAPGRVGVSVADIACGMYAHAGVLQALYERERTGRGRGVSVSLFDAIADWMTVPLLHQDYGGKAPRRVGLNHPSIAPYGAFALGDGHAVVISIQNEREWRRLCEVALERPELATDPRFASGTARVANRPALDAAIGAVFAAMNREEARERLSRAGIAFGSVNGVAELSTHPQLRRIAVDTPTGPVSMVAPPQRWNDDAFAPNPVPTIGQHNESVRWEFAE
ncbi:CoA transferase [Azospirillum sp. RWY-5-1]|uniref:CoA transferase n=1 Tax=Azospirillum oleiclasticum TaxID=2735135 RepID=A0ABX2TMB4_9PROT|nr:CaiB/BaiF CoA-transferase family protein [Azospirillum oleiclasticum]NYZ17332.1 CoA transferase [Azospirillum oleiclasticum]NYZ24726.1 CoA transferase [Azospirillum oleiclasticum]